MKSNIGRAESQIYAVVTGLDSQANFTWPMHSEHAEGIQGKDDERGHVTRGLALGTPLTAGRMKNPFVPLPDMVGCVTSRYSRERSAATSHPPRRAPLVAAPRPRAASDTSATGSLAARRLYRGVGSVASVGRTPLPGCGGRTTMPKCSKLLISRRVHRPRGRRDVTPPISPAVACATACRRHRQRFRRGVRRPPRHSAEPVCVHDSSRRAVPRLPCRDGRAGGQGRHVSRRQALP